MNSQKQELEIQIFGFFGFESIIAIHIYDFNFLKIEFEIHKTIDLICTYAEKLSRKFS